MSPLLGPILAQLVTLGLSDRTEARYIASDDKYFELATLPRASLNFGWKHTTLTLGYGPSFTVTPLDSGDQAELVIFHNAFVAGDYRWRRTTVGVSEYLGVGRVNFETLALTTGAPGVVDKPGTTPGGTATNGGMPVAGTGTGTGTGTVTGIPAANQIRATDRIIAYAISSTTLSITQLVSPVFRVNGEVGYVVTGGIESTPAADYPLVKGPRALASGTYHVTRQDDAISTLSWQYGAASTGIDSWVSLASETWAHAFDARTNSQLGAGVSATRSSQPDGLVAYSIYPTFIATITHTTPLDRGTLSYGFGVSAAPVLDPVRALVDPRVSLLGTLGWGRDRFFSALAAGSLLSLDKQSTAGALSSATGSFTVGYRLGAGFSVDSGLRATWQSFEGHTTVPLSWAAFVGLTYTAALPLGGGI